jgi:hypothetical protein
LHEACRSDAHENASNLHFLAEFGFFYRRNNKDISKGNPRVNKGRKGTGSAQLARDDTSSLVGSKEMSASLT